DQTPLSCAQVRRRAGQACAHRRDNWWGGREIHVRAEFDEALLEVAHHFISGAGRMRLRSRSSARDRRDLTVPSAQSSTAAVSATPRSRKYRQATTSRSASSSDVTAR